MFCCVTWASFRQPAFTTSTHEYSHRDVSHERFPVSGIRFAKVSDLFGHAAGYERKAYTASVAYDAISSFYGDSAMLARHVPILLSVSSGISHTSFYPVRYDQVMWPFGLSGNIVHQEIVKEIMDIIIYYRSNSYLVLLELIIQKHYSRR